MNLFDLLNLSRPKGRAKVVIDTDTFNEIDDQFAIAYALKSTEKIHVEAIYAAPFLNEKSHSPKRGMELSYDEIKNILMLLGRTEFMDNVFRGSERFMTKENDPIESNASRDLVRRALDMPEGERLYVLAIGAPTNVASAILIEPKIVDKIVVVFLGGNAIYWNNNWEFNAKQDTYATKILFDSKVPLVQLPCSPVTSHLTTTEPELRHYLFGKNDLCDYLYNITCSEAAHKKKGKAWSKEIWDIIVVAWIVGDESWMTDALIHSPILTHEHTISVDYTRHFINQIQQIKRDKIFEDLFNKLTT